MDKYRHYFDIDSEYFAQVNEAVIRKYPDIWKKYYPHETFVKLMKDTVSVLTRKQKLSIWVEGAYGTGKSHAVLTLKKLLDASDEDMKTYFSTYPQQLSQDMYLDLKRLKSDDKKIITVHRYGSSNIYGDNSLVFAIQESIEQALTAAGIHNSGTDALKSAAIKWLSQSWAKEAINNLIKEKYADLFRGDDVDSIIKKLQTYQGNDLISLMSKVSKVGEENHFKALSLDVNGLVKWIKDVIRENDLKAIVFIWDEFTNYFENNLRALTGFQQIVEISATDPFYMIIVTHKSAGLFSDTDKDQKRILDRFVKPTCNIMLPENMAFRLMGSAMVKNNDPVVYDEWLDIAEELYDRTKESRSIVKAKANISDDELKNILPIHPYAALLLKYISSAFDSNQRSMFDFIKNDRGDEIKGFQWFIDNFGPESENPFLTIDMLWDFFYEKGKEYLSSDIRSILDCYSRASSRHLNPEEQRVFKTVLLLQAISQKAGDTIEIFIPNEKNVNNAFEGSDIHTGAAARIAEKLCRDELLYRKPLGGNQFQFSALVNVGDVTAIEKLKIGIKQKTTTALIEEGNISEVITLSGFLKLRYLLKFTAVDGFNVAVADQIEQVEKLENRIAVVVALAKDDGEGATISKKIEECIAREGCQIIFIDASVTPLGNDALDQYAEAMANSQYYSRSDTSLANQYESNAKDVLRKWKNRIEVGEFLVAYRDTNGEIRNLRLATVAQLTDLLGQIDKNRFECGLETGSPVIDNMWFASSLRAGVECGASQTTKSSFNSSNSSTKLENFIGQDAWQQPEGSRPYWEEKPYLLISKIKLKVKSTVDEYFQKEGRVSIVTIYDELKKPPFGFLPCNLTAFVLGFVLKEYLTGTFSWTDGMQNEVLNIVKLKEMVSEVIMLQITPNSRYRDKYIVMLTKEERSFNETSSMVFGIPLNQCTSITETRKHIRNSMRALEFPIWCLKYTNSASGYKTSSDLVNKLIDLYVGIVNNGNTAEAKSESDIAMDIGKCCLQNPELVEDLKSIMTQNKCVEGMENYLKTFEEGALPALAHEIGDGGQYINVLKSKFDADAANWVWNQGTAQMKIREVILEYRIIFESNKLNSKATSYAETITNWCDKCSYIRLSYAAAKNSLGNIGDFVAMLCDMKKQGGLLETQKQNFYDQLSANGPEFSRFYNNQIDVFRQVCSYYIDPYDFTSEEVSELYKSLPLNCLVKERSEYLTTVSEKVKEFNNSRSSAKLKEIWKGNTGTASPLAWSAMYKMPVLCMVKDEQMEVAKNAFSALNGTQVGASSVENAIKFLETADFYGKLKSAEERDKAFKTYIIKGYDILLTDLNEVKEYLDRVVSATPYDWLGLPEVDRKIKKMAEAKYSESGYEKALEKIDSMNNADVKRYIKDLIRENMIVGIEIMRED